MKRIVFFIVAFQSGLATTNAQNPQVVDSLTSLIKKVEAQKQISRSNYDIRQDTTLADALYNLSSEYWANDAEKGMLYARQCLAVSQKTNYKTGIAKAYNSMGAINFFMSNHAQALDYYQKSMQLEEELGNRKRVARLSGNIANIYIQQRLYDQALSSLQKSLDISKQLNDKGAEMHQYNNLGTLYQEQKMYAEALTSYNRALEISRKRGSRNEEAGTLGNIANLYVSEEKYDSAKIYLSASIKLKEMVGDNYGLGLGYVGFGKVYAAQQNYREAGNYLNKALEMAEKIDAKAIKGMAYEQLFIINSKQKKFEEALRYHVLFQQLREEIFNLENSKQISDLKTNYAVQSKENEIKAEQEKKDLITSEEIKKQKLIRNSISGGLLVVLLFSIVVFRQRNKIAKEKQRSDELLLNILPSEVAEELKEKGSAAAKQFDEVTVMFTDFKGFTQISEKLSPTELVDEIHTCFKAFDHIISKHNIEKIKTIGDSYMCAGGLPVTNKTNTSDVIKAALEIQQFMQQHLQQRKNENKETFEIRIGIHTGPVVAGIVGIKKFAYDIWGDTVNTASRMESSGEVGKVNISGSTYDLVKDKFNCVHRGKIQAKNKGEIDMYFVLDAHKMK